MIHNNFESTSNDNQSEQKTEISNSPFISEIEEAIPENIGRDDQPISEVLNEVKDESTIISPANNQNEKADNQNEVDIALTTSNTTNETVQFDTENVLKKGNVAAIVRLFSQDTGR